MFKKRLISIDGASAKVDLKTQTAEVSYDREINDDGFISCYRKSWISYSVYDS